MPNDPDFMDLIRSEEPLDPELEPWTYTDPQFGRCLKHPLVFEIGGVHPGLANHIFRTKKAELHNALARGLWHTYVFLHERPFRSAALIQLKQLAEKRVSPEEFAKLVGQVWTDTENHHQTIAEWWLLWSFVDDMQLRRELMTDEEWQALTELPQTVTVYRGCVTDLNDTEGLSWTLDRDKAVWFANRFRELAGSGSPIVHVGEVNKNDILAYFQSRNEEEIVSDNVHVLRTEDA